MPSFEVLNRQPNFPNEDLSEANMPMIEHYLQRDAGVESRAEHSKALLRQIHVTAHEALRHCGVALDYTPEEYAAFCNGFASYEYVSLLVNPRVISGAVLINNVRYILTDKGDLTDIELSERFDGWAKSYPNLREVVLDAGIQKGETMQQLQTRLVGLQIATELEMAA
jgi:hypothetical protein